MKTEYREPKCGEKVYVPTRISIGHGQDDVRGGSATINKVHREKCENEYNTVFLSVREVQGKRYNWRSLIDNQVKYKELYGHLTAKNDPDYHDYGDRW